MFEVHKGRRDDVSTLHGPLPGRAPSIAYLIGLRRRSLITELPVTVVPAPIRRYT